MCVCMYVYIYAQACTHMSFVIYVQYIKTYTYLLYSKFLHSFSVATRTPAMPLSIPTVGLQPKPYTNPKPRPPQKQKNINPKP